MHHPLRILSIEDDPKDTKLIQDLLETGGVVCEVTRVDTQAALLASLEQGGIDLILADYSLPSFDGISALKLAMKACPDVPFIFVSGALGEEVAIEALKIGATDYVLKTSLSRLVPSVRRALREASQKAERKRAEEALRQSEAYLAEAQRLSHTGSFGWKPCTGEILWSEETFRIFQYDRPTKPTIEVILQRVHPEDVASVKETVERASQDGKDYEHEYRLVMPDGAIKHVRVVAHADRDESGELEFVGAVMDTSESKRAEKKLRRSEESLLEAQKLSHTGSWRHDVASGAVTVSPEIYRIHDINPEDDASNTKFFFSKFHPEDRKRVVDLFERAEIEKIEFQVDYRIVLPDGTIKHLHTTGHPILNDSGDLVEFVGTAMDVTAAKQAEEALRRSEGYLAQAQRLTHSGSWALNVHTGARFWSQETFRIFGCDPEKVKPTWSDILERVHPEDRAAIVQKAEMETALKEDSESDWRIVLPDGTIRHLHSIAHPVMDEAGEITEVVGTLMDVTEPMRAEALRDGESRILKMIARDAPLEEILDNLVRVVEAHFAGLLCSVLLLDEDGQHVRHGAAPSLPESYTKAIDGLSIGPKAGSCGTAMYRREPVVVTDILQDPLWEPYRSVAEPYGFRACWSTPILAHSSKVLGSFAMYYREPRSPSSAETHALEMATHLAGIAIEGKLTHEQLRRSEAYLAEAQRLSHTGSWAFNARGAVYWSEENFQIWGFNPQQGPPDRETVLQRIHPEDRDRVIEHVQKSAREKKDYAVEFRIVLPDGTVKHIHGLGHPVFSASGELVEVVGTQLDVTERKRADEERERLRQAQADLAHLSRVTTMGELTASLAHEIRQPISAAVTNAKTCLRWLGRDEPDVAEAREAASRLVKDVTRAADIIGKISSLFKKDALQRELVDVNELIREMIVLLRSEANRYSISIRTELAEGLPKVMADRVQLQQVFMNLMLNGIDAMKETSGGSELAIKSETDDGQLLISVSDTGVGLPSEQADQIFRAFFTTKDKGTGMGLPISRSIIESHGGRLWATANSGPGATLQFTLPATIAAHA